MASAIKVENLSKAYQLGDIGTGTLISDFARWYAKVRGREDPFLKIGETNDRTTKGTSDVVWSLKDINFEIQEGEAVGIIGRNGAGKSTLLKLLSRVTSPTIGNFKIKGRIASLLEVGTGFHPELTGRENIYLNGAILGMRKKEIQRKFDEIVDFSGVERYIDTPVKRYSSGMYVRLAFAVAAHLESEILIVDEVLAVGDAEFQKKCLGKMGDVSSGEGRTILFVSHNMAAIQQLCNKGILLKNGQIYYDGEIKPTLKEYKKLQNNVFIINLKDRTDRSGNGLIRFTLIEFYDKYGNKLSNIWTGQDVYIKCYFKNNIADSKNYPVRFDINITDENESLVSQLTTFYQKDTAFINSESTYYTVHIPKLPLLPSTYSLGIYCKIGGDEADWIMNAIEIVIEEGDFFDCGNVMPRGFGTTAIPHNIELT